MLHLGLRVSSWDIKWHVPCSFPHQLILPLLLNVFLFLHHAEILLSCLKLMKEKLKRNICNLHRQNCNSANHAKISVFGTN